MSRLFTSNKTPTSEPVTLPKEKIAMRAYEKWMKRGRPQGTAMQDWLEAETELRAEQARTGHRR